MEADISIWRKPGHFYFALTETIFLERTEEAEAARRTHALSYWSPPCAAAS